MDEEKQTDYTHGLLPTVPTHNKLQLAIKQQNTIGWDHLVRSRLSKLWKEVQKIHNSTGLNQWSKHFIKDIQKINNTLGQTQGQNAKKTKIIAPKTKAPHGNTQTTMTTFCTKPPTPTDAPT